MIARQILDEEGGDLRIDAEPNGIMCVRISLPIEAANNGDELDGDPPGAPGDESRRDVGGPMANERVGDTS